MATIYSFVWAKQTQSYMKMLVAKLSIYEPDINIQNSNSEVTLNSSTFASHILKQYFPWMLSKKIETIQLWMS